MRNKPKRKGVLIDGIRYYSDKPESCAVKNPDGSVFVAGPLYITHPVIGETENRNIDLSAVDFCEAMAYITTHTVTASIISGFITGYLLEKED